MTIVLLVFGLVAGDTNLLNVGHNDEVTGIHVRGVFRLVFAAQAASDFGGEAAEHLVCGNPPQTTRASPHVVWRKKFSSAPSYGCLIGERRGV